MGVEYEDGETNMRTVEEKYLGVIKPGMTAKFMNKDGKLGDLREVVLQSMNSDGSGWTVEFTDTKDVEQVDYVWLTDFEVPEIDRRLASTALAPPGSSHTTLICMSAIFLVFMAYMRGIPV